MIPSRFSVLVEITFVTIPLADVRGGSLDIVISERKWHISIRNIDCSTGSSPFFTACSHPLLNVSIHISPFLSDSDLPFDLFAAMLLICMPALQ